MIGELIASESLLLLSGAVELSNQLDLGEAMGYIKVLGVRNRFM